MSSIGGYFGLEINDGNEYHQDAIRLNTARNAFEYILISKKYNKVYIPFYSCDVLLEPLKKLKVGFDYYPIDDNLEPLFDFTKIKIDEGFLYINYFGVKEEYILNLIKKSRNIIVDNAQAFYSKPLKDIDTFYSPRKYFGVPDGGYLYTNTSINIELDQAVSYDKFGHLLRRIDVGPEKGYKYFVENDNSLRGLPILRMSNITLKLLRSFDYRRIADKRRKNFEYIHEKLKYLNKLNISITGGIIPLAYPFHTDDNDLRKKLISNHIYVPQYWPNVMDWVSPNSIEFGLTNCLVPLPIDQRISIEDIDRMIEFVVNGD